MADPNNVKSIFLAASELPAAERPAFLDEAAGDDTALRVRVEALLNAHDNPDSFLKEPAAEFGATVDLSPADPPLAERPGTLIGPYKLLEQIGEGGMGVVYMADQQAPVRRRVALKIIKAGMDTRQVIARFEAERQALALMDHSNIARVLDAGATDSGRPYFVMELVRGIPITEYCDQNNLPVHERLELFVQVCHAVQHAHQKGIIHRDLKPTNVLVTTNDGRAVPKVIDFGVAKATGRQLTEKTLFTAFAQMVGTPLYMSPEQAEMSSDDIDTRSDIYSLGVLLYELLTGTTPFDQERMRAAAFDEIRRIIREEEPPKPSTRISTLGESRTATAAQRQVDSHGLSRLVEGDLDWIVMKALDKDRTRRYDTATGMADDIHCYLSDQPVEAGQPTRRYRLKKFIRRNKAGVLTGSAVIAALAVGLAMATVGFVRARTEAVRSDQVAQFLKDMLAAAGPSVSRGRDATMLREILGKTAERVERELQDQPEVQGELWYTLGTTYWDIGDFPRAVTMYRHAVDSYRSALGNRDTKLALGLVRLGRCQSFTGNVSEGKANAQLGLDIARKCGDPETLAACLRDMASACNVWGKGSSEAVPYLREALALRKQFGNDPVELADCMRALAICSVIGIGERESLSRAALALYRQHLEPDHPKVAADLFVLGQVLLDRGKLEDAEKVLREAFDLWAKVYDKNDPYRPVVLRFLAEALARQGKWDEAEALIREGMEAEAQSSTNEYFHDDSVMLVRLKASQGQLQEALGESARLIEAYPKDDSLKFNRTIVLMQMGQHDEYRRLCHELLQRDGYEPTKVLAARLALLLPVDGADFKRACQLADAAASAKVLEGFGAGIITTAHLTKALADYRRGRFESANECAKRVTADGDAEKHHAVQARIIQAMASARLQQTVFARAALAKCDELLNEPHVDFIGGDGGGGCGEWATAELLRREAAELLGISTLVTPAASATQP